MRNHVRLHLHWLLSFTVLVIGFFVFQFISENNRKELAERQQLKLENAHERAINRFSKSINKFAAIASGMHAYMELSPVLPEAAHFQQFVRLQLEDIGLTDPVVVSFMDTSHTFKYCFTADEMDPAGLVGTSVSAIRNEKEIDRLNALMDQDDLKLFAPLNLVEGWPGIPIDFRVRRNDTTIGYVAIIVNFKSIVQSNYAGNSNREFAFHFSTDQGIDLDREQVYDGSKVYNSSLDPEYYKELGLDTGDFIYSDVHQYGMGFRIGTGYKSKLDKNSEVASILYGWYFTFFVFVVLVSLQMSKVKVLNQRIEIGKEELEKRQLEIVAKNAELTQLVHTKDKFCSIIGHDLRGPINSIQGLLHLLNNEEIKDPQLRKIVQELWKTTKNTDSLLSNLLRWAMAEGGDLEFAPRQLVINEMIEDVVGLLSQQAADKQIEIKVEMAPSIYFLADADMLSTTIRNLVSNSIKFTDAGGIVEVKVVETNNELQVVVKDNGIGISPENLVKIFDLAGTERQVGTMGEFGTGLGLILCQEFVERHSGRLDVASELGKGTVFTVVLPKLS